MRGLRAMCLVALVTILPLYLDKEMEMSPFFRGIHIGLLIAIGLIAKPMMGYLSDRL
ncbi:MAG TPA: MFS transporter, partial [Dehalococcoidia bacterium]|nr:MFS transporter [Dehalococcoidia bacterium]